MNLALILALATSQPAIEPQPLPDGVADSGINVLLDQSHQMGFMWVWSVQGAVRNEGHRVTCNMASLHRVLTPGAPILVRDQADHRFPRGGEDPLHRPIGEMPAPEFDVVVTMQTSDVQQYLPEERAALKAFVEAGGGLVCVTRAGTNGHPLNEFLAELGVTPGDPAEAPAWAMEAPDISDVEHALDAASCEDGWSALLGESVIAEKQLGDGWVLVVADDRICYAKDDQGRNQPRGELLDWLIVRAMGERPRRTDDRQAPWEHGGIGGAIWPENLLDLGGISVLYADNQLPEIVGAAKDGFSDVRDKLQELLPTPPNPGGDMYIVLASGNGGGWAENVFHPKVAGTIATDINHIKSILAHELTHTMYGPKATEGKMGCGMPAWFSEAHAGFFQRKTMHELGLPGDLYGYTGLMSWDPLLDEIDLTNIGEGEMGKAWRKVWFIWTLLDARYGGSWYPNWLAYVDDKYADDRSHVMNMDEYVISISESVGEDVAPLFRKLGTTINETTDLPPIAPR